MEDYPRIDCLDKGFVRLIDSMGDDARIVQAARVSYQKGTKAVSTDRHLIRYLLRNLHCYDEETEVLTRVGFKPWPEVKKEDELGIWDEGNSSLFYEQPEYLTKDWYEGEMYRVDHEGVDLLVTPEHTMWVKHKKWDTLENKVSWTHNWNEIKAKNLNHRTMIRYSKLAPFRYSRHANSPYNNVSTFRDYVPEYGRDIAFLTLLGFFVGNGHAGKTMQNCISFHLKKSRKVAFLQALCEQLGFQIKEKSGSHYYVYGKSLGKFCRESFYDTDKKKRLPEWTRRLLQDEARAFIEGLKNSDGSKKRGAWEFSTSVKSVAEAVQHIALHAGEAVHFYENPAGCEMWRVMFMSRMREPVINQNRKNTSWQNYKGFVYCAKTRTGILVVRRNGKIVLSGNTTPLEKVRFEFHVKLPLFIARQWMRHRMGCLAGDTQLYFDLPSGKPWKRYNLTIEEIYNRWQATKNKHRPDKQLNPYHKKDCVKKMRLRMCDESTGKISHTNIVDVWKSGVKSVYRVTLDNGYQIKMTKDHRCLTSSGWQTMGDAVNLHHNLDTNLVAWDADCSFAVNGMPIYQSKKWLSDMRLNGASVQEMADAAGCSCPTIRAWLKKHQLQFSKEERQKLSPIGVGKTPWNKGEKYKFGSRKWSKKHLDAIRRARSGPASNFWKGGVSSDRQNIGRWTTEQSSKVHKSNEYKCKICNSNKELCVHHIIPVWMDATLAKDINNLTTLCKSCHTRLHAYNAESAFVYAYKKGTTKSFWEMVKVPQIAKNKPKPKVKRLEQTWANISSVEYIGEEMTYDLEVAGPYHNFVANGFIVHNSFNEASGRYSILPDQFYIPNPLRKQSSTNRQGSSNEVVSGIPVFSPGLDEQENPQTYIEDLCKSAYEEYENLLEVGTARELARSVLPVNIYTEFYWTVDLWNLMHFLRLRIDDHAQYEIRVYANAILNLIKENCDLPYAIEAFEDYIIDNPKFSKYEAEIVVNILKEQGLMDEVIKRINNDPKMSKRERKESKLIEFLEREKNDSQQRDQINNKEDEK